jgi:hypothetical protein
LRPSGNFHLVIAGDGIDSDVQAIAAHPGGGSFAAARLYLLEGQLRSDPAGRTLVVPTLPMRTESSDSGSWSSVALGSQPVGGAVIRIDRSICHRSRTGNRVIWQRLIDDERFDHPRVAAPPWRRELGSPGPAEAGILDDGQPDER